MGTNITGIGNANAIGFKSRVTGGIYFPPELKDALVGVWSAYGKSNDSTDRNIIKNKIKDRGGDFVISNAAYKLNSGYGKYEEDFTDWRIYPNIKVTDNVITTNGNFNSTWFIYKHSSESKINEMNIKVSGIPKGGKILYFYISDETDNSPIKYTIPKDGIYHLPESKINNNRVSVGFTVESRYDWNNIRIEQIPSFEGAFVTDGVNDLITSTKTVQEMGVTDEITIVSMIHQIQLNPSSSITNDIRVSSNNTSSSNGRIVVSAKNKTGIYGWSRKGNTKVIITKILGDKNDYSLAGENSTNYNNKFSVVGTVDNRYNSSVAWYWTIIANKVLTTDQINQVIAYYNLDKYVKPDIYYNVKKQGLTNDTPDENWYLKDFSGNGRDMTLYNYARTPESGINEEGGLQSDGVVDYGQFVGDLGLKDYTVVIDRAYNNLINNQVPLISSNIVEDQTPFIVEHWNTGSNAISFSYGTSRTTDIPLDINKKIVYQSTYSYMGYVIPKGNAISTGNGITLGKFGNGVQYSAICLWSLMLFPYSMSEFLIERQLKKYKLGTLYPDMVEFRPVIKANANYKITYYQIDSTNTWKSIKVGDYIVIGAKLAFQITFDNDASELKEVVSPQLSGIIVEKRPSNPGYNIYSYITSKSPQKINITIDEYIRFEDIVQPYPVIFQITDRNTNQRYSWGDKIKVGSSIRLSQGEKPNLLSGLYSIKSYEYEGETYSYNQLTNLNIILTKQSISLSCNKTWLLDDNEPKCILSPRLLRIPNSSYKILGYIPDISGHGNHGVIHNSAYAEGSGVNEDGSYQFDGVDDFVDIPTLSSGGKQVLMKVNSLNSDVNVIYDQRLPTNMKGTFAIMCDNNLAYSSWNTGQTYIDGMLNKNITGNQLVNITHNLTITHDGVTNNNSKSPFIGKSTDTEKYAKMSLYDFMLFDEISTDDKIKELNEYVGIEAKVELPPYYWDAYGKTNLDADKATIQQRGVAVGDYDLTNTNFAYDKMSGFGGYEFEKFTNTTKWIETKREDGIEVIEKNDYSFTAKKVGTGQYFWDFKNNSIKTLDRDLTVKAISNNNVYIRWEFKYRTAEKPDIDSTIILLRQAMTPNVPITVTLPYKTQEEQTELGVVEGSTYYLFYFDPSDIPVGDEYTVEMLPLYPNGLVYDGVSDFTNNKNIPILTDFTFIIKREILGLETNDPMLVIKGDKVYNNGIKNAFILEHNNNGVNYVYSYGKLNQIKRDDSKIIYLTPESYNGNPIIKGENGDNLGLILSRYWKGIIYKTILYSKTISLLEINFLKNLMEKDEIIDLNNPIFIKNE